MTCIGTYCNDGSKAQKPWKAQIQIGKQRKLIGYFATEKEASDAVTSAIARQKVLAPN